MRSFFKNLVGQKILMAVSGLFMTLFLTAHLLGNMTIYTGGLNAYAEQLHALVPLVWISRISMLTLLLLHIYFAIKLTLENRDAKPVGYAVSKNIRSTFASRNMIWSGLAVAIFIIYHLLHLTVPAASGSVSLDSMGRPDISGMVVEGFQGGLVAVIYLVSLLGLLLHIIHGIQSSFQSLGLSGEDAAPVIHRAGIIVALVLSAGFLSIPLIIFVGIVKG
ncbi:MAG: succinate dehydrogenase cytochrome b subunit [Nitrospira sp.]|nr:succinate dehydrogenase cytochrome b subunit [Nitrospira sp.]